MRPEELGAWQALLQEEFEKPYWRTLAERVDAAYAASTVYPPREALFAAFRMTPPEAVRVVILGQDPYHEPGQARAEFLTLLDSLDEKYRTVLLLYYGEGFRTAEIASILNLKEETVKTRLKRARAGFKQVYEAE